MKNTLRFYRLLLTGAVVIFSAHVFGNVRFVANTPTGKPDTLAVWVMFADKAGVEKAADALVPSALARRRAAGYLRTTTQDASVAPQYVHRIELLGGKLRQHFKWGNAASFDLPASALRQVRALPFVADVTLIGRFRQNTGQTGNTKRRSAVSGDAYGTAIEQLTMMAIPRAHCYLRYLHPEQAPGEGVRIAFFDSGFRLDHRCFRYLREHGGIKGMRDFIDDDATVADPDSVNRNPGHPYWTNDNHGTEVLACALAYDPPWYCGAAWGADVLLARTEDTYTDSLSGEEHELHTEEDDWASAVVWAESLGVDIISSSLGYRYGFQDTVIIRRADGSSDTIVDYLKRDLDGATTIVSVAAQGAIERGVFIVNAAGNEQADGETSISAPADVDGVVAVGAVNYDGTLTFFSSLGPSADGRTKPDIVAPGYRIFIPAVATPRSFDYSDVNSGTSFATPLAAGVCLLIKQAFPGARADEVRERLYRYCRLPAGQMATDNRYGRGIPDALRSCMQRNDEVFLTASDSGGLPFKDAIIVTGEGDTIGRTDTAGNALFHAPGPLPLQLSVVRGAQRRSFRIDYLPCSKEILPCSLVVSIRDDDGHVLAGAAIRIRIDNHDQILLADSSGLAVVERFFPAEVRYVVTQSGYIKSDTLRALLGERRTSVAVTLQSNGNPLFEVYPTVLRRSRGGKLIVKYRNPLASGEQHPAAVTIRSVYGTVVWHRIVDPAGVPVTLQWDGKCPDGRSSAPGIYFLQLTNAAQKYRVKFIIAE